MGLYKRGMVWWMSFSHQGQQYWRSTETDDKKLAQRIFDKLRGEIAEGKWFEKLPGEAYTFKNLMEKYMAEYSAVNKKASSHKRDKSLAAHLLKSFGDAYLTDIKSEMVSDYKTNRRTEGASPRTINYELTLMGHAFNIAIREWEWIEDNPIKRVKKERVNNFKERWLSPEEEKNLLKTAPIWLQDIIIFAIHTGMRRSEILDLKWSQVDLKKRTIFIAEQKNGSVDTLPISRTVLNLLETRKTDTTTPDDYVFASRLNKRREPRVLSQAFERSLKAASIKNFRFHDLRHTFATRLVQQGVGIYEVQKLGRWKNTSMVMRYAHHYPESLRSSIEVMDNIKEAA